MYNYYILVDRYVGIMKKFTAFLLGLALLSSACSGDEDKSTEPKVNQGVITFSIEYPEVPKQGLYYLLPKEMHITYKGDIYKTEVLQKGARFKTVLIADNKNHTLTAAYEFGRDKFYTELSKGEVDKFLEQFPELDYVNNNETDSLLGVNCSKSIALFNDISREVPLMYTNELGMEGSNWCNPYKSIEGVLLQYGVELYGVHMDYVATKLNRDTTIADQSFSIPEGYEKVPYDKIETELEKLFDQVKVK